MLTRQFFGLLLVLWIIELLTVIWLADWRARTASDREEAEFQRQMAIAGQMTARYDAMDELLARMGEPNDDILH